MTLNDSVPLARPAVISPSRVAVVTGAASGIGLGLATRLSENRNGAVACRAQEILDGSPPVPPFP
jgi:hypothetical protein